MIEQTESPGVSEGKIQGARLAPQAVVPRDEWKPGAATFLAPVTGVAIGAVRIVAPVHRTGHSRRG
jgi:hypothetical protein